MARTITLEPAQVVEVLDVASEQTVDVELTEEGLAKLLAAFD